MYWYIGKNKDCRSVLPISSLKYEAKAEINEDSLKKLFVCSCCGKQIYQDQITYWWFK